MSSVLNPDCLLEAEDLLLSFGGTVALSDVSLGIRRDAVVGIIGPNGAGKTSLLNCASGYYRPQAGSIRFDGQLLDGVPIHRRVSLGLGRTFQGIELCDELTVVENVLIGAYHRVPKRFLAGALHIGPGRRAEHELRGEAEEILEFLGLAGRRDARVSELPHGQQKLVDIGRALASRPLMLLMDEPTSGMNPQEKAAVKAVVRRIQEERGVTVVLIEHDIKFIGDLCQDLWVLNYGRVIAHGDPAEVFDEPAVVEAYLGKGFDKGSRHG